MFVYVSDQQEGVNGFKFDFLVLFPSWSGTVPYPGPLNKQLLSMCSCCLTRWLSPF